MLARRCPSSSRLKVVSQDKIRVVVLALRHMFFQKRSGKKKEHKLKVLGPDLFRWGGCLPREGEGAKKFGMSFEIRET